MSTRTQQNQEMIAACEKLAVDELGELVDHLGNGTLTGIRKRPWQHRVAHLLPAENDTHAVHALWMLLMAVHNNRSLVLNEHPIDEGEQDVQYRSY